MTTSFQSDSLFVYNLMLKLPVRLPFSGLTRVIYVEQIKLVSSIFSLSVYKLFYADFSLWLKPKIQFNFFCVCVYFLIFVLYSLRNCSIVGQGFPQWLTGLFHEFKHMIQIILMLHGDAKPQTSAFLCTVQHLQRLISTTVRQTVLNASQFSLILLQTFYFLFKTLSL